ncbi:MAG: PAS domain S-box-containing protein [Verrucomicrobiales bacterium]|jgi:PAS domain S-box-containing protein
MKLRWKIQLALLSIALLPFIVAGVIGYTQARETLEERFIHHLESVASLQERRVTSIFERNLERLRLVSSRTQLRLSLSRYNDSPSDEEREKISQIIEDALQPIEQIEEISVFDAIGKLVASTNPARTTDESIAGDPTFENLRARDRIAGLSVDDDENLSMELVGPLELEGQRLGMILVRLSGEELLQVAETYEGLGRTGETLLAVQGANGEVRYIAPGRFSNDGSSLMNSIPADPNAPIFAAIKRDEKIVPNAIDYRGESVLSVTRFVETATLGVEVKVDRAEALEPAQRLRTLTLINMAITLGVVSLVSLALGKSILKPIEDLTRSAHIIESGDYDYRVVVKGKDEISELGEAFNLMAQQLTLANRSLEEKVQNRTEQLQTTKERFELAVQGSDAGIWDWDLSSDEVYFSDRFKELLGYGKDELENKFEAWESRLHPDEREDVVAAMHEHLEVRENEGGDRIFDREYRLQLRDGNFRWFHARGMAFRDETGKPSRMSGSITDINSRRQYEDKLRQSVRELEQFAYVASHDLREPLRMVASYVKLLERRYSDKLDESAHDFIRFAVDGANRMQRLIEDLLTYSQVGSKPQELEPLHAEETLTDAIQNLQEAIKETDAKITYDPLPLISGDQTQLTQLFQNLIANAIKFRGDKQPEIHISVKPDHGQWQFSIKDNGIGIKKDYQDRIFKIFQRLHSREDYDGTGIGLAVVNKIIERHHGRIWVESAEGEGSTFYFTLDRPL